MSNITGYWQGGQLGITSFVYEAADARGVIFDGAFALYESWGLNAAATARRIIQAIDAIFSFPPSSHLLARKLGAWPAKMIGAQTAIFLGWISYYAFGFAGKCPMECEYQLKLLPSSSDEREAQSVKRKRELTG